MYELNEEQKDLIARVKLFADREIAPFLDTLPTRSSLRLDLFVKMAKQGFLDLSMHPQTRTLGYVLAVKAISSMDAGIGVGMSVTNMAAEAIDLFGTESQKKKILRAIGEGNAVPIAFALTEKMAGSDVKALQLNAVPDPDNAQSYFLDGEKQFITNGDIAPLLIVMAQTPQGISAFLVDRNTPGLTVSNIEEKLGLLSVNLCALRFEKCRIPKANVLGRFGDGLRIALTSLDSGRLGIAAQALGIAEAAYTSALEYAKTREQFGKPLFAHQTVAFDLADMHVKLSAGNLLLLKAAYAKDQGRSFTLEASEAKLYCSEICNEIASGALQIYGGYGYVKGYNSAEKYFRDARATTLYEGTSAIQRIVISRHL